MLFKVIAKWQIVKLKRVIFPVYINLDINSRYIHVVYTARIFHCSAFSNTFLLNSLKDFERFKLVVIKFQNWAPQEAVVSVSYRTVFTFLPCRRTSLRKSYQWFLMSNTSFIIYKLQIFQLLRFTGYVDGYLQNYLFLKADEMMIWSRCRLAQVLSHVNYWFDI